MSKKKKEVVNCGGEKKKKRPGKKSDGQVPEGSKGGKERPKRDGCAREKGR